MKTKLQLFSNVALLVLLVVIVISKMQNIDRARLTPTRSTASIRELNGLIPVNKIRQYIKGEDEIEISTENNSIIKASWRDYKRRTWFFLAKRIKGDKWKLTISAPPVSKDEKLSLMTIKSEIGQSSNIQNISITYP